MNHGKPPAPFPCTACGQCCRHVDRLHAPAAFPYAHTNGVCEQLDSEGRCKVYETRPLVCRVDALADALGADRALWHRVTAAACDELQAAAHLPRRWRVTLTPA